jgi:hypothetical protein
LSATTTIAIGVSHGIAFDGKRAGLTAVVPESDGVGEFGEGRREPMPRVDIDTEFVVAAPETSHVR